MAEPKVRFKRDDGTLYPDLRNATMGDFYTERNERGEKGLPMLTVSIHSGISDGELDEEELGKRVNRSADVSLYKKAVKGDLVFNMMRAWQGAVGSTKSTGMVSPAYIVALPNKEIDPTFMNYYVQTKTIINRFNRLSYGALDFRKRLYWDSFIAAEVNIPVIEEQQKIADFLSSVDEVIAVSEQEVANLETQKKAVMKKVFSQEVRFKKEDGTYYPKWKEQSFEKTFEPLNNNTFSRDMLNYTAGPALNIHYGDVLVKYGDVCDIDKDVLPFVNEGQDVTKYAALRDGDIVLADTAEDEAVGKAIEVINIQDRIVVSGLHTIACRPRIAFSLKYLGYYLNSAEFHDQLRPFIQGIKVSSIGRKNISGVLVKYPSDLEEQRLIANFLSNFDEAISAAKKELELWKELKKGLLQQMFV